MSCPVALLLIHAVAMLCATHRLTAGERHCRVVRVVAILGSTGCLIDAVTMPSVL